MSDDKVEYILINQTQHISLNCSKINTFHFLISQNTAIIFNSFDKSYKAFAEVNNSTKYEIGTSLSNASSHKIAGFDFGNSSGTLTVSCSPSSNNKFEMDAIVYSPLCNDFRVFSTLSNDIFQLADYQQYFQEKLIKNQTLNFCYIYSSFDSSYHVKNYYRIPNDLSNNANHFFVCQNQKECYPLTDEGISEKDFNNTSAFIWSSSSFSQETMRMNLNIKTRTSQPKTRIQCKSFIRGNQFSLIDFDPDDLHQENNHSKQMKMVLIILISIVSFIVFVLLLFLCYSLVKTRIIASDSTSGNQTKGKILSNLDKLRAEPPLLQDH